MNGLAKLLGLDRETVAKSFSVCVGLALSEQSGHFFGIYLALHSFSPSVLDSNRFHYCFHKTAVSLLMITVCQCLKSADVRACCVPCARLFSVTSFKQLSCVFGILLSQQNASLPCPPITSRYFQFFQRGLLWYVHQASFLGHESSVCFPIANLKSVGSRKSLVGIKRLFPPTFLVRNCLL